MTMEGDNLGRVIGDFLELEENDSKMPRIRYVMKFQNHPDLIMFFDPAEDFFNWLDHFRPIRMALMIRIQQYEAQKRKEFLIDKEKTIGELEVELGLKHTPTNQEEINKREQQLKDILGENNG